MVSGIRVMNRLGWHRVSLVAVALSLAVLLIMLPSVVGAAPDLTPDLDPDGDTATINLSTSDGGPTHYTLVSDDSDTTYVYSQANNYETDLYTLTDTTTAPGKINSVTVNFRASAEVNGTAPSARAVISVGGTPYSSTTEHTLTTSWTGYTGVWNTNPSDGSEWTWADVNALQAGVELKKADTPPQNSMCSEVWVVVDYTPATLESYRDAAHTIVWGTVANPYDSTYSTAYMNGTNYLPSHSYRVIYYDGNTETGGDQVVADNQSSTAGYELSSQIILSSYPASQAGTWHAVVYDNEVLGASTPPATYNDRLTTNAYVYDDDFEVLQGAIPEFPTVIAGIVVAGSCFGIFYWMRKRRLAYVKV